MTTETFVVAYNGDDQADGTLKYAIERAKRDDAALVIVHVLEWSPYKFLTPSEIEERQKRRRDEMSRAQSMMLDPAVETAKAAGVDATGVMNFGNAVDIICKAAKDNNASMIFVGRSGDGGFSQRVFGSVTMGLAQSAPAPLVIVP